MNDNGLNAIANKKVARRNLKEIYRRFTTKERKAFITSTKSSPAERKRSNPSKPGIKAWAVDREVSGLKQMIKDGLINAPQKTKKA